MTRECESDCPPFRDFDLPMRAEHKRNSCFCLDCGFQLMHMSGVAYFASS